MLAFEVRNRSLMELDVERIHGRSEKVGLENRMILPVLAKIAVNLFVFYMFLFRAFGDKLDRRFIW